MLLSRAVLPVAITSLLIAPVTAFGQTATQPEVRGYIGGGLGYFRLDDEDFPEDEDEINDSRWSWRAFAGMEANRVFSLEVGYTDFGRTEDGDVKLDASGWTIAGLAALPITPWFAPYGKVGQLFWDREREVGPLSRSDSSNDLFYGVGARFTLTPNTDLRLEYERMAMADTDVDMGSINLQFRF